MELLFFSDKKTDDDYVLPPSCKPITNPLLDTYTCINDNDLGDLLINRTVSTVTSHSMTIIDMRPWTSSKRSNQPVLYLFNPKALKQMRKIFLDFNKTRFLKNGQERQVAWDFEWFLKFQEKKE